MDKQQSRKKPGVSICIPVYKQVESLKRTLDSVITQDYQDYEIIVSDDSPDDSIEKLLSTFKFEDKLIYWRNFPAKGSPENWNAAIKKASGKYIKILHHDDWFSSTESLGKFVEMLDQNPEADFAFSASIDVLGEAKKSQIFSPPVAKIELLREEPMRLLMENLVGAPSATIFRSSVIQRFDKHLKWLVDIEFYLRLIKKNAYFVYTKKALVSISADHGDRITNVCLDNKEVEIFEHFYVFNKHRKSMNPSIRNTCLQHLLSLIIKHNIHTRDEIRKTGYLSVIPRYILLYFGLKLFSKKLSARAIFKLMDIQQKRLPA